MRLLSFTIQGFRSIAAQQEFDFTKLKPGLYHLAGDNQVEPEISPNGAGKSTLLEAPCWIAYGTTSRKLKAGNVKNWHSKDQCGGVLELQTAQHKVGIFRTWSPNVLEVSLDDGTPRTVDQREIDSLLGLSFDAYLFSVFYSQFAPAFIDLRPADQMAVYSNVLGLDLWEKAGDTSSKFAKDLDITINRHKEGVATLKGNLEEVERQLASLEGAEQAFIKQMVAREEELTKAAKEAEKSVKAAEAERAKHVAGAQKFRDQRELEKAAASAVTVAAAEVRRLEGEVEKLKRQDIKVCPTCGGPVDKKHVREEAKKQEALLAAAEKKVADADLTHQARVKDMAKFRDSEANLIAAERALGEAQGQHKAAVAALERLQQEENPFDKQRVSAQRQKAVVAGELADREKKLGETEVAQGQAAFWGRSFKELRLSLIEESLAQLSIEANSALVELGLKNWSLEFDVERETKKGTVSKGFTIFVRAPHVKDAVPWEVWSGGESQRLRVAASLGFGDLICSRMGVSPNVEFWDEPSQWLSEGGIHDLLASLRDRALKRGKVILLADHRALDFGGFAGTVMVTRNAKGSEVSVS